MQATLADGVVHVDAPARERFYDNRGYGRADGAALVLAPVEAAHLLFRGDLSDVDGMGLRSFLAVTECLVPFLVYKDLRDRGFYLSPARWTDAEDCDLVVYPRGQGPWDGTVEYRVSVVSERTAVPGEALTGTLAVVDEESEITYLGVGSPELGGGSAVDLPTDVPGTLLGDRVVLWDPPDALYRQAFYGQPLDGREAAGPLQCSLVEAAYLADRGVLAVDAGAAGVRERGQSVEGERFDRRLAAYRALRERGVVPKTGYKFGADFRVYDDVTSVDELGHSTALVRVLPGDHTFDPRDLALDVRLAHGVRKTMTFALVGDGAVEWRSVERLTP